MAKPLDATTVRKVATKLARISANPSDEFVAKFGQELGAILEYVEKLQEVDTDGLKPTDGIRTITYEELRADEPARDQEEYGRVRQNIIEQFPHKNGVLLELRGFSKTPRGTPGLTLLSMHTISDDRQNPRYRFLEGLIGYTSLCSLLLMVLLTLWSPSFNGGVFDCFLAPVAPEVHPQRHVHDLQLPATATVGEA